MSEIGAAAIEHDTHLSPILFRDGSDRRLSARIPLATAVKIGPPNGTPYALVSASDLSKGGLFIDADRPVRVGARFSAEIELSHTKIYVPEAEVAYNRERHDGCGFGVRFVSLEEDALSAVEEEIDRLTEQTLIVRSKKNISELPTLPPSMRPSALGVELSTYPEPEIVDEAFERSIAAFELDSVIEASRISERLQVGLRETRQRFMERAKSAPAIFRVLAIAGSVGLVASAAFAVAQGAGADTIAPAHDPTEHGVASSTHQVLMGKQDVAALDRPAAIEPASIDDPKLRRKLLPPLVVLDEEKIAARPHVVSAAQLERGPVKPPVRIATPKSAPKPKTEIVAKPKPAITKPSIAKPSKRMILSGVDLGARVLKTHVFRAPDRFVIDLVGQTSALQAPASVRTGRHPEFFRVVIDAAKLGTGRATIEGRTLVVELQ